jgi:hypothetical protein
MNSILQKSQISKKGRDNEIGFSREQPLMPSVYRKISGNEVPLKTRM